MNNVDRGRVIVLFVLQILYTNFFFATRLIINKINKVQWVDFKLENVLVSLHSLKTMGLGAFGASAPLFLRNGELLEHSPILNCRFNAVIFTVLILCLKQHEIFFKFQLITAYVFLSIMWQYASICIHDYTRMEITVLYLKISRHQLLISLLQISVYWLHYRVTSQLNLRPSNSPLIP